LLSNPSMRKLNNRLKFELLSTKTNLGELIEHLEVDNWDAWMSQDPMDKKELVAVTVDGTTLKVIDYLALSTKKHRAKSAIINALLIQGLKSFFEWGEYGPKEDS